MPIRDLSNISYFFRSLIPKDRRVSTVRNTMHSLKRPRHIGFLSNEHLEQRELLAGLTVQVRQVKGLPASNRMRFTAAQPFGIRQANSESNPIAIPEAVGIQYANSLTVDDIKRISEFGFKTIRIAMNPTHLNFDRYQTLVSAMWDQGITPMIILLSRSDLNTESGQKEFIQASEKLVEMFSSGDVIWDAWNEPTSPRFWSQGAKPRIFADYAVKLVGMIRSIAPQHQIIMPSIPRIDQSNINFLKGIFDYRPELLKQIDYLSVHVYGPANGRGPYDPESKILSINQLRNTLTQRYGRVPEIVISEFGWHTKGGGSVSNAMQGVYAPRLILNSVSNQIPMTIYYQWRDEASEINVSEPGIQTIDYKPRPAYYGLKTLINELNGYHYVRNINRSGVFILLFANQKSNQKIAYWSNGTHRTSLRFRFNNSQVITLKNISQQPRYLQIN